MKSSGWNKLIGSSYLFVNKKNANEVCLVNTDKAYLDFDFDEAVIKRALTPDECKAFYQERIVVADFVYNPYQTKTLMQGEESVEILNTYRPPEWKKAHFFHQVELPPLPPTPPALIDRYLSHLVGGDLASKEYILDWLATALKARNYTILTAIGDYGIGKGRLGDIMQALVGPTNFTRVRDTVFKKQFNAPLKNKQIVYVDEIDIHKNEEADRVKDVVNSSLEIEAKGVDASLIENHASFYITSNRMDAIKIEGNDRRYSMIELTSENILNVFSRQEVGDLTSPENILDFALYLLGREIKHDMFRPFRSKRFHDVLEAGLSRWQIYLIERYFPAFDVGANISVSKIQADLEVWEPGQRPPGREKIAELAKTFHWSLKYKKEKGERIIEILKKPIRKEFEPV